MYPSKALDIAVSSLLILRVFPFKKFHLFVRNKWIDADSGGRAV